MPSAEDLDYDPRLNDLAARIRTPIGMILSELPEDLPEQVWYRFSFDVCVMKSGVQNEARAPALLLDRGHARGLRARVRGAAPLRGRHRGDERRFPQS